MNVSDHDALDESQEDLKEPKEPEEPPKNPNDPYTFMHKVNPNLLTFMTQEQLNVRKWILGQL